MTTSFEPTCPPVHRPARLLAAGAPAHALRGAGTRLSGTTRIVDVYLFRDPPAELADVRRWRLDPPPGGARVAVAAAAVVALPVPHVELTLAGAPETGRYRLRVLPAVGTTPPEPPAPVLAFDPLRTWVPVRLRPECPDYEACADDVPAADLPKPSGVHDYLARDWTSLRRALVEMLRRDDPSADLSVADPTITVLELFAHIGDLLHYRLDRVATEAYLETARLRTSVRRHARLVDFAVEEAASATTTVLVTTAPGSADLDVAPGMVAASAPGSATAFTLEEGRTIRAALGEIAIYDWSEDACCLPAGATECVLVRPRPADALGNAWLRAGELLVFEVVDPGDAVRHRDWTRRAADWPAPHGGVAAFRDPLPSRTAQVVRLVEVAPLDDPLAPAGMVLTRVRWDAADALARAYPVGIDTGAGGAEVTVARANLVPAHHGRLVRGSGTIAPRDPQPTSPASDGEHSLVAAGVRRFGGAGLALRPDGAPHRLDLRVTLPSGTVVDADVLPDLLLAPPARLAAVVDVEEDEPPLLRFRTGAVGLAPPLGSRVTAAYELGGGSAGNVPANALGVLERDDGGGADGAAASWTQIATARNPVVATGGRDAIPLADVRRDAPEAFAAVPRRAVLPADHAELARREPGVQRASARRSWSGSWPLVRVALDLLDDPREGEDERVDRVRALLDDVRMLGSEVAVVPGTPVGLLVALDVCAVPGSDPARVRAAILRALRPGTDERPGLFHSSRMHLGGALYLSSVVAAAAAVPGVDAVELREARRLSDPPGTVRQVVTVAPYEVVVLDDDPAVPRRGRLEVVVRGGP
ncbi:MAG TPA: hypothetical protein VGX28_09460 [Frankiaceae bacterium]|nr:hypothetical protein [Frankiaceae bacterium]